MAIYRSRLFIGNSQNMDRIGTNEVDFIFTGPPYWNHLNYSAESGQLGNIDDYEQFHLEVAKVWEECYRVLKPGSMLCIQANDLYEHDGETILRRIPLMEDFSRRITQKGFVPVNTIFWDSYLPVRSGRMPEEERKGARSRRIIPQRMQYLVLFIKQENEESKKRKYARTLTKYYWQPYWAIKTERKCLGSRSLYTLTRCIMSRMPMGEITENGLVKWIKDKAISDFRKDDAYPAASDYTVVKKVLADFTEEGDLVLDPFAGSGTTLMAAYDLRRRCIGYEVNRDAAEIIRNRFDGEVDIS